MILYLKIILSILAIIIWYQGNQYVQYQNTLTQVSSKPFSPGGEYGKTWIKYKDVKYDTTYITNTRIH